MKLKKAALKAVGKIVNKVTSSTVQGTSAGVKSGYTADSELIALCRRIGAESVVMLKNNGNVLPLDRSRKVSVFGRVQNDYFYVGYGSGGDVNAPYKISLLQALRNDPDITVNTELADEYERRCAAEPVDNGFWGHWPMCYDELSIDAATAKKAAANSDTAIVVIGRAAGEDRENKLEKGSYYLTDEETALLDSVTAEFDKVIVLLNCGSIMDMAALDAYGDKISALLYVWQSGMESGNALADVLSGRVSPSGKLTDTIARDYYDYPSAKDFGGKDYNFYTEYVNDDGTVTIQNLGDNLLAVGYIKLSDAKVSVDDSALAKAQRAMAQPGVETDVLARFIPVAENDAEEPDNVERPLGAELITVNGANNDNDGIVFDFLDTVLGSISAMFKKIISFFANIFGFFR